MPGGRAPRPTKGGRGPDLWLASLDSWMSNCFNGDRGFARFLGGESGARPTKGEPDLWLASLDSWEAANCFNGDRSSARFLGSELCCSDSKRPERIRKG